MKAYQDYRRGIVADLKQDDRIDNFEGRQVCQGAGTGRLAAPEGHDLAGLVCSHEEVNVIVAEGCMAMPTDLK